MIGTASTTSTHTICLMWVDVQRPHKHYIDTPDTCLQTNLCCTCSTLTHPHSHFTHAHTCSLTHAHTHTHSHMLTHAHTHTYTHIHTHTFSHMLTLTHTHTYTLTHSHTHTYLRSCRPIRSWCSRQPHWTLTSIARKTWLNRE